MRETLGGVWKNTGINANNGRERGDTGSKNGETKLAKFLRVSVTGADSI